MNKKGKWKIARESPDYTMKFRMIPHINHCCRCDPDLKDVLITHKAVYCKLHLLIVKNEQSGKNVA